MDTVIREIDLPRDADGIARMFNACDPAWPAPFNDGQPITAEMILEWHAEEAYLAVYLAEVDGVIAGYASFGEGEEGQQGEGYLHLLTVDPAYHGRSIGRKLVQACVNRATQEGFARHTLGTWPNNLKAVPAYKKTGHFWRPETSVWMQNYVPTVARMPICKPFFARHDWYDTYVREIVQQEDDFRWEGLKVYPMRWEAEGEALAVWIDRETQAPVAVETDELFLAAIPGAIEALHGDAVDIHWRITNKTDTVERFMVDARGADGLEIDHREMFVVQPGATVEHVAPVKVTDSAPYSKDDDIAPSVRSVITFGHHDVELFSGLRARKPLELSTDVAELSATPGRALAINLQIENRRATPVAGVVRLAPADGLSTSWTTQHFEAPARGFLTVPVTVIGEGEGVYALQARLTVADEEKPVIENLAVFCVNPGGLVMQGDASSARIETDAVRVMVAAKKGNTTITDKVTREMLASFGPLMGPPYDTAEMHRRSFAVAVEQVGPRAIIDLVAESQGRPGLLVRERLTVATTGLVEATAWLENRGTVSTEADVRLDIHRGRGDQFRTAAPLPEGIIEASAGWWPRLPSDIPRDPAAYAEPWLAWQAHNRAAGVGWRGGVGRVRSEWHASIYGVRRQLAPGDKTRPLQVAFWGHAGAWPAVRAQLCQWAGVSPLPLRVRSMAEARLEPALVLTTNTGVSAQVQADSVMARAFDGRVTLALDAPLTADMQQFDAPGLIQGQQVAKEVTFALPADQTGVYGGEARLALPILRNATPFHLVRVGLGGEVAVASEQDRGQEVWRVDNGLTTVRVAPGFGPTVYSLRIRGEEQLYSPYPRIDGFSWERPFYGGLNPQLWPASSQFFGQHLSRAACTAAPVEATDRWGLSWRGVRLCARSEHEQLRGLVVEFDVLTVGRSPLLKMVYRLINERGASLDVMRGLNAAIGLGLPLTEVTLVAEDAWHQDSLLGHDRSGLLWGAVLNPHDGRAALLTSNQPVIGLWSAGFDGRLLNGGGLVRLAAGATHETTYYLALADSLAAAKAYTVLQDA